MCYSHRDQEAREEARSTMREREERKRREERARKEPGKPALAKERELVRA